MKRQQHTQPPSSCPGKATWNLFYVGALPPVEKESLMSHVQSCGFCKTIHETLSDSRMKKVPIEDAFPIAPQPSALPTPGLTRHPDRPVGVAELEALWEHGTLKEWRRYELLIDLPPGRRLHLTRHLDHCATCRAALEIVRQQKEGFDRFLKRSSTGKDRELLRLTDSISREQLAEAVRQAPIAPPAGGFTLRADTPFGVCDVPVEPYRIRTSGGNGTGLLFRLDEQPVSVVAVPRKKGITVYCVMSEQTTKHAGLSVFVHQAAQAGEEHCAMSILDFHITRKADMGVFDPAVPLLISFVVTSLPLGSVMTVYLFRRPVFLREEAAQMELSLLPAKSRKKRRGKQPVS